MVTEIGTAYLSIVPSVKGFPETLKKELGGVEDEIAKKSARGGFGRKIFGGLTKIAKGTGIAAGATFAASMVKGFGRLSAIENAEAKLKGLGHTTSEVEAITKNALNSVKGTAYGLDEAAGLAGNLVASGIKPGKDLERILKLVGDSAAISGREMSDMGLIWMQVASKGKLTGEDAMQLMEAGLPVWQMVGDQMNVTAAEAQDLASKGKVSFDVFAKAMEEKVGGAALASGNTTAGAFKNMNAALGRFGAEVLKGVFPLIGPMFKNLTVGIDAATKAVGPLVEAFSSRLVGVVKIVGDRVSAFKKVLATDWITPDLVKALGLDPSSGFGTVVKEAIGGVLAFKNAWVAFDGDVTSSGFPGFMERAAFAVRTFWEGQLKPLGTWVMANWPKVLATLGSVAAVVGINKLSDAIKGAMQAAGKSGFSGMLSMLGKSIGGLLPGLGKIGPALRLAFGPVGLIVGALGYLVTTNTSVRASFMELLTAVGSVATTLVSALVPVLSSLTAALVPVVTAVASGIAPALDALAPVISTVVGWVAQLIQILAPFAPQLLAVAGAVMVGVKAFGLYQAVMATGAALGSTTFLASLNAMTVGMVRNRVAMLASTAAQKAQLVWTKAQTAAQWLWNAAMTANPIGLVIAGVAALVGALVLFFTKTELGRQIWGSAWGFIKDTAAGVASWFTGSVVPAFQAAWDGIAAGAQWLWENAIVPAWDGIKGAIDATIQWVTGTAIPWLQSAWDAVADAAQWLWKSVIEPVWTGIKFAIALAVAVIMTEIDAWVWVFQNAVAPVFEWLWKSVIEPVWNGIKDAISAVVQWFQNTAWPIISSVINSLKVAFTWLWQSVIIPVWNGIKSAIQAVVSWFQTVAWPMVSRVISQLQNAFNWLWQNVIVPVWNGIKSAISAVVSWFQNTAWPVISSVIENVKRGFNIMKDAVGRAWSFVKNRAIAPVVDWFTGTLWPKISGVIENVKKGFDGMKDAVGKAWQGVKSAAIEPVNFVINAVYNKGIRDNFMSVADKLGLKDINLPKFQGFARGGILPGFSRMRDGDDQLVAARRGEGWMVSEALRTAKDRALFLAANAAGRRGVGLADYMAGIKGFAGGGILDKVGSVAGDILDGGKKLLKGAWDFVSDPVGAFKGLVGGLFKKIPGAGFFKELALGVGKKILDGVVNKVQSVFSPASNPDAAPVSVPPGASRSLGYAQKVARGMGLTMTSFRRRGSRTAGSGSVSLHALGRAMDFSNSSGPTRQMMAFFNAMHPLHPTELLYSPAGRRQWRRSGRMADTSGITKRMHYNHVHVGFAKGGIIPASIIGGYKPFLHDRGGWHMPGELSINQTQKPEAVLTAKQWETVARSLDHATSGGMTINVTPPPVDDPGTWAQRIGDTLNLRGAALSI